MRGRRGETWRSSGAAGSTQQAQVDSTYLHLPPVDDLPIVPAHLLGKLAEAVEQLLSCHCILEHTVAALCLVHLFTAVAFTHTHIN